MYDLARYFMVCLICTFCLKYFHLAVHDERTSIDMQSDNKRFCHQKNY